MVKRGRYKWKTLRDDEVLVERFLELNLPKASRLPDGEGALRTWVRTIEKDGTKKTEPSVLFPLTIENAKAIGKKLLEWVAERES